MTTLRFVSRETAELHALRRRVLKRSAIFADRGTESSYNESNLPSHKRSLSVLMGLGYLGVLVLWLGGALDPGEGGQSSLFLALTVAYIVSAAPLYIETIVSPRYTTLRTVGLIWFALSSAFVTWIMIAGQADTAGAILTGGFFLLLTYLLLPGRVSTRAILGASITVVWLLGLWLLCHPTGQPARVHLSLLLLAVNLVGAAIAHILGSERRIQFYLLRQDHSAAAQEQEILMGARIQRTLLLADPQQDVAGMTIAVQTLPSQNIDGDFFDFFPLSPTVLDLIVGDVMGKGISAALVGAAVKMAYMRSMVDMATGGERAAPPLTHVMRHTEVQLSAELMQLERFVTMYSCRLDAHRRSLAFVDCGHTYIAHYSRREGTAWIFKGSNMPIGFTLHQEFREQQVPIEDGDILLWYSDGLTDVRNSEGDVFGEERIMYYLTGHPDGEPRMILNELLSLVFDFSVTETTDDVTCILLRYDQPATPEIAQPREGVIQEELQEFPVTADLLERGRAMTTEQLTRAQLPEDFVIECTYGVHEALANIWVHVFKGKPAPSQRVTLHLRAHADWWYASIRYRGSAFRTDPSRELDTTAFQENGYGMAIIHSVMDSVVLCQGTDTRMKLIMAKRLPT